MWPVALTIAGSDPCGGAGVQGDLKTFQRHEVYGAAVVTLVTVQDTTAVRRVEVLDAALVGEQLDAVLSDLAPAACKTGALGSEAIVDAVAERVAACVEARALPLVVDPVRIATHGSPLLSEGARRALLERLLPRAALVTPNAEEAAWLSGTPVDDEVGAERAARRLLETGVGAVLLKGGHLPGASAIDLLFSAHGRERFESPRLPGRFHGLGCALSAAITARLARGDALPVAVAAARRWLAAAMSAAPRVGAGLLPVHHGAAPPDAPLGGTPGDPGDDP